MTTLEMARGKGRKYEGNDLVYNSPFSFPFISRIFLYLEFEGAYIFLVAP